MLNVKILRNRWGLRLPTLEGFDSDACDRNDVITKTRVDVFRRFALDVNRLDIW